MQRQALYACITCTAEGKLSGAICLPCMYKCHDNHDLVELWTKRWVKPYESLYNILFDTILCQYLVL